MIDQFGASFDTTAGMLVLFRITALLVGAFLLFLGYRLFKLGYFEKAGELSVAWGKRRLVLKQVAPGIFFALFGTVIVCVGIWKPLSFQPSEGVPEPIIAALQKVASKEELSESERLSITAWLQRRAERGYIANEPRANTGRSM